jgi:hypothetical protein
MAESHFLKEGPLIGSSTEDCLGVVSERLSALRTSDDQADVKKVSYWQLILLQSKANGCFYGSKDLPHNIWAWPKRTWFQKRLTHYLKEGQVAAY